MCARGWKMCVFQVTYQMTVTLTGQLPCDAWLEHT